MKPNVFRGSAWALVSGQAMGLLAVASLLLVTGAARAADECKATMSPTDAAAIKATIEKYRTSWLAGDAEGVMSTLTEDAVILPAGGADPVVGSDAIRKYWWPGGAPVTKITKLDITYEQIGGDCRIGYARGRDSVGWTIEEKGSTKSHENFGVYLNVMKKQPDGSWRISHHMWDDDPSKRK
ncbi:MAG: SgcJ/EcaC family oxidoreductase [Candidatus Acidiferrales bacterium]